MIRSARFLLLAVLLGMLAFRGIQPATAADLERGLLWKVERPGLRPSYVFGTVHAADAEARTLPAPVAQAFLEATSFTLEIEITPAVRGQMLSAKLASPGEPLDRMLPAALFRDVLARAAAYWGPHRDLVRVMKPWAVLATFSLPPSQFRLQAQGWAMLDEWLQRQAKGNAKPVHALETAVEQVDAYAGLPLSAQVGLLRVLLDSGDPEQGFAVLRDLYRRREIGRMLAGWEQSLAQLDPADAAAVRAHFLDDRNQRMVERMMPQLKEGNAFVAVGALHLPGDRGILRLLERQGYIVSAVY
jgi:uncharacterized protein